MQLQSASPDNVLENHHWLTRYILLSQSLEVAPRDPKQDPNPIPSDRNRPILHYCIPCILSLPSSWPLPITFSPLSGTRAIYQVYICYAYVCVGLALASSARLHALHVSTRLICMRFDSLRKRQRFMIASQLRTSMACSRIPLVLFSLVLALLLRGEYNKTRYTSPVWQAST